MSAMEEIDGIIGISHFGIVVHDIETAFEQYKMLGFKERDKGIITEEERGISAKVIESDNHIIELMSVIDTSRNPAYDDLLKLKRYSLDHICYKVTSIEKVIKILKKKRFSPISKIAISSVWNKRVVLLANRRMGVIELVEIAEK